VSNAEDQQRAIAGLRGTFSALRALRGIADWHALAEAVPRELCAHTEIERAALFLVVDGAAVAESVCFGEDVRWANEFRATSRANPVPLVIPCHRVVSANGEGGFMGKTGGPALRIKRWLLAHERAR
jgi:hypothetical protein